MYYTNVTEGGSARLEHRKNILEALTTVMGVLGSKLHYGVNEMRAFFFFYIAYAPALSGFDAVPFSSDHLCRSFSHRSSAASTWVGFS